MTKEELKKQREDALKLQEAFASQKKKYEESKGYDACPEKSAQDEMYHLMCYFDKCVGNLYSAIYRCEDALWEHKTVGHIPKIIGAGKMTEALKALGLSSDYQVEKKVVYASKDTKGNISIQF